MSLSRRIFLRYSALGLVSYGLDPLFLDRAVYALRSAGRVPSAEPPSRRVLVCLFQRGAVDGLSMIVPHGESAYYRERPRIAIPASSLVDLDGHFGLHPALAPLKPFWDNGSLCAVHAVGSPDSSRSHFDAQDYMETGTPGIKSTPDGWANRYCQNAAEHVNTPFRAVGFGPQLPRILAGSAPALAIDDLRTFGMRARTEGGSDRLTRAFEALYEAGGPATGLLATSAEESVEAIRMLKAANPAALAPEHGAEYPRTRLGQSLQQIAQLIKANLGLEIAFADMGGWDTHVNQGNQQGQLAQRLQELGQSLAAFATDLGERMSEVCVLTMSEFGRTVRENGSSGTDHGHATAMLLLGGTVRGKQIAGRWPGIASEARYEGRDLAVTTDFRDLFGEVLTRHLGARDLSVVFPRYRVEEARFPGVIG